jgi:succinate dehydrogenase / fumarate reductase flavoprotein subunit
MAIAALGMDGESAFRYGEKRADPALTKAVWFQKIVKHGFYLSEQDLVQHYVEAAGPRVHELLGWCKRAKQRCMFIPPGSWFTSGKALGLGCLQGVRETPGIDLLEDVMISDLLLKDGRVVGAFGIDIYTGELISFRARAVVLCTGGYQPFSFRCTHSGTTGDGMAMAYRAGAQLADMEFLLFLPGVLLSPRVHRGSSFPFLWYVAGFAMPDVVNEAGDNITAHIPPQLVEMARSREWLKLIFAYYWGKEIAAGKGTANGGLYFDFSNLSRRRYLWAALKTFVMLKRWYPKNWRYQGEDMGDLYWMARKGIPWEIGLSSEYSMGGIVVDAEMRTGLAGLFAGGEVTSGVFGAGRGASALTEMLIQGYKAGESAAEYAREAEDAEIDADQLADIKECTLRPFSRKRGISPAAVQAAIEVAADSGFSFIRNEAGLKTTLLEIERIRDENMPQMNVRSPSRAYNNEWLEAMQIKNLLTCIEGGVRAAIMRRESRGYHIRADYREVDHDNWLQRIVVSTVNGKMTLTKRKPTSTWIGLPTGKHENIMQYAGKCGKELMDIGVTGV